MSAKVAHPLFALDLDRTLIYSRAAAGRPVSTDWPAVENLRGVDSSFMTATAAAALNRLTQRAHVIPATTRTIAQFSRLRLPTAAWRYAVTTNGGNILIDGNPDPRWRTTISDQLQRTGSASLTEVRTALHARISETWAQQVHVADDLFCYLSVTPTAMPDEFLAEWSQWCTDRGWTVSRQGRKVYAMPVAVCKSAAITEVKSRLIRSGDLHPHANTYAAGDGLLDAALLRHATAAIRPRHGELESLNWAHPTVTVTDRSGAVAAEDILRWCAQKLRS